MWLCLSHQQGSISGLLLAKALKKQGFQRVSIPLRDVVQKLGIISLSKRSQLHQLYSSTPIGERIGRLARYASYHV